MVNYLTIVWVKCYKSTTLNLAFYCIFCINYNIAVANVRLNYSQRKEFITHITLRWSAMIGDWVFLISEKSLLEEINPNHLIKLQSTLVASKNIQISRQPDQSFLCMFLLRIVGNSRRLQV